MENAKINFFGNKPNIFFLSRISIGIDNKRNISVTKIGKEPIPTLRIEKALPNESTPPIKMKNKTVINPR